jgi:hypothetical protein
MPLTLSNSNYNGEVSDNLYIVLATGNDVAKKGATKTYANVSTKKSLPKLSQTADPIGVFVDGAPSTDTATTTYAERLLQPGKGTLYQRFKPHQFHDIWEKWKSAGDFTNLELNSELMNAILNRYRNGIGTQVAKLFWQGDANLATSNPLHIHDGIITRGLADGSVIAVTPAGNITEQSFVDILAAVWSAIPNKYIDDPDFALHVNTTDWKTMQTGNTKLKEAFTGVFGMSMENMYNMHRIKHFDGLPQHHILGARVTGDEESNLCNAVWVDADEEGFRVDRVANNSNEWFIRLDVKLDANYIEASDLVLYKPS